MVSPIEYDMPFRPAQTTTCYAISCGEIVIHAKGLHQTVVYLPKELQVLFSEQGMTVNCYADCHQSDDQQHGTNDFECFAVHFKILPSYITI
jgi:hypothetical protein